MRRLLRWAVTLSIVAVILGLSVIGLAGAVIARRHHSPSSGSARRSVHRLGWITEHAGSRSPTGLELAGKRAGPRLIGTGKDAERREYSMSVSPRCSVTG